MHTRDQAATLWCPMVRMAHIEDTVDLGERHAGAVEHVVGGCNTDALGGTRVPASARCIADQCSMWRWVVDPTKLPIVVGLPANAEQRAAHVGYCGLAGHPAP